MAADFLRFFLTAAHAFDNHSAPKKRQQDKRYPVVPGQNKLGRQQAQQPANQRRDGFDYAKDQSRAERFRKFGFMECGAFADGSRECVHGHTEGKKQGCRKIHYSVLTGITIYTPTAPSKKRPRAYGLA